MKSGFAVDDLRRRGSDNSQALCSSDVAFFGGSTDRVFEGEASAVGLEGLDISRVSVVGICSAESGPGPAVVGDCKGDFPLASDNFVIWFHD